jgi:hypothetical protein
MTSKIRRILLMNVPTVNHYGWDTGCSGNMNWSRIRTDQKIGSGYHSNKIFKRRLIAKIYIVFRDCAFR